ncbi:MAG: response regulator [Bacteroidales bacterium]|nr:response regulator [Bacteroidales bacterium]
MKRYNAIIIDDERNVREALNLSVKQSCPEIIICGMAASAEEGRQLLRLHEVSIIFLDISMPREDGFDFLNSIEKEKYCIVFTTAYQEFALQAIKANAVDYLLKPVNPLELKEAVKKAVAWYEMRQSKPDVQKTYSEPSKIWMNLAIRQQNHEKNNGRRTIRIQGT